MKLKPSRPEKLSVDREPSSTDPTEEVRNYVIFIDGTLCEEIPNNEAGRMAHAAVHPEAVESCNRLFDRGHLITFVTARDERHRDLTESWLMEHGFNYHEIVFGTTREGGRSVIIDGAPHRIRSVGTFDDLASEVSAIAAGRM
jgi:hypothetical protein